MDYLGERSFHPAHLVIVGAVEDQQGVQVAIAGVRDGWQRDIVTLADLDDAGHELWQLLSGHRHVLGQHGLAEPLEGGPHSAPHLDQHVGFDLVCGVVHESGAVGLADLGQAGDPAIRLIPLGLHQ